MINLPILFESQYQSSASEINSNLNTLHAINKCSTNNCLTAKLYSYFYCIFVFSTQEKSRLIYRLNALLQTIHKFLVIFLSTVLKKEKYIYLQKAPAPFQMLPENMIMKIFAIIHSTEGKECKKSTLYTLVFISSMNQKEVTDKKKRN